MALTEETINDKIEVVTKPDCNWSCVGVRTATVIKRDGTEISRTFSRKMIMPNATISGEDADVQAVCTAVFTDTVKANYATWLSNQSE